MFKVTNIYSLLIYVNCMTIFGNIHAVEKAHACPYLATRKYQEEFTSLTNAMTGIVSSVTYSSTR